VGFDDRVRDERGCAEQHWLETLTVQINAPKEVADQIVAKVDWNAVNGALTR
jgi:hypothetical protein